MTPFRRQDATRLLVTVLLLWAALVRAGAAATYVVTQASELQPTTDGLQAGDTLLVAPGDYVVSTWRIRNLQGFPGAWIEIRAMGGPVRIIGNANQNVINVDNVRFVRISGFEITYQGGNSDIDGLKFNAGTVSHRVILDNLWVHDVTGVALNSKADELSYLDISRCHLHDTGGTGEGMYLGCNGAACWIHSSVVRQNHVHDTRGSQGDGIEIKPGSFRNVVEDNVVYRTNDWVGITLYRTQRDDVQDNNVVRRNVSWDSGECFFTAAETFLHDNVAFDCAYGINTNDHSGLGVRDLLIAHNTIFDCPQAGIRLGNWDIATGYMRAYSNASYQPGGVGPALRAPQGIGPAVSQVEGNVYHGGNEWPVGATPGQSEVLDLTNAVSTPGLIDLSPSPGSVLIDAGANREWFEPLDFELQPRLNGRDPDAGAYESEGPALWQIAEQRKPLPEDGGPVSVSSTFAGLERPMLLRKISSVAAQITWNADTCRSWNYHLVGGELADVGSYDVSVANCYVGNQGRHDVFLPLDGRDYWFLMIGGGDDQTAGPLGLDSFGDWRPDAALGSCGLETAAPPRACN